MPESDRASVSLELVKACVFLLTIDPFVAVLKTAAHIQNKCVLAGG